MTIRVKGLREVVTKLTRLGAEVDDLKDVFEQVGKLVADDAKKLAPTRTGRLAESIRPSRTKNRAQVRAGSARINYGRFIEYGTTKRRGRFFLWGAMKDNQARIAEETDAGIRRVAAKIGLK